MISHISWDKIFQVVLLTFHVFLKLHSILCINLKKKKKWTERPTRTSVVVLWIFWLTMQNLTLFNAIKLTAVVPGCVYIETGLLMNVLISHTNISPWNSFVWLQLSTSSNLPIHWFFTFFISINSLQSSFPLHFLLPQHKQGFPGGSIKNPPTRQENLGSIPGLGRFPGGGHGNPFQYSCLENPHGQRGLVGYSPWGCKESDTTERLSTTTTQLAQ